MMGKSAYGYGSLVSCMLSLAVFLLFRSKASQRRGVLLIGLCDSGKTLIFSRVRLKKLVTKYLLFA